MVSLLSALRLAARGFRPDTYEADDLVEATLRSALANVELCPANGSLWQWLYGIMVMLTTVG